MCWYGRRILTQCVSPRGRTVSCVLESNYKTTMWFWLVRKRLRGIWGRWWTRNKGFSTARQTAMPLLVTIWTRRLRCPQQYFDWKSGDSNSEKKRQISNIVVRELYDGTSYVWFPLRRPNKWFLVWLGWIYLIRWRRRVSKVLYRTNWPLWNQFHQRRSYLSYRNQFWKATNRL